MHSFLSNIKGQLSWPMRADRDRWRLEGCDNRMRGVRRVESAAS
jgi:hypothetical protein